MRRQILKSMKAHALGQIEKHKMNVNIYLENAVGVGEHINTLETIEKEMDMIGHFEEQLEVIEKYFSK